jgi:LPS sulfotransferase NodH
MANPIVTVFEDIGKWFKSIFQKAPSWATIALASVNVAAIAFEGITAALAPALAAVADPIITEIQAKLATAVQLIKSANATSSGTVLATIEADLSQLESIANISDATTKAKIAAIVATINAVIASLPAGTANG